MTDLDYKTKKYLIQFRNEKKEKIIALRKEACALAAQVREMDTLIQSNHIEEEVKEESEMLAAYEIQKPDDFFRKFKAEIVQNGTK